VTGQFLVFSNEFGLGREACGDVSFQFLSKERECTTKDSSGMNVGSVLSEDQRIEQSELVFAGQREFALAKRKT
jgi:hypothetical protein